MRLVRITTENNNCFFESVFNSDLIIKPYSKIALASFTTQLDNLNMVIDSQNNEISYSCDGVGNIKTLTLPNGVYTSSTVQDFWIEVTRLFNQSMAYTKNQINRQWFCGLENGRATFKLLTGTRVAPQSYIYSGLYVTKNLMSGGAGQGKLKRLNTIDPIGNDAYLYIKSPNNKGCSSLRATLNNDNTGGEASGFVLGYTASNPISGAETINPNSYLYGVRYIDLNQPYKYIVNGVETVSGIDPAINDIIELAIYGGYIYFYIYRANNNEVETIHDISYNHQTDLFPLCLFVGRDTVINAIQFTSDPYYNITNSHTGETILSANSNIVTIPANKIATQCYIQFNNPDLATILGYNKSRYPTDGFITVAEPDFIADKPFTLRDFSESYVIELLNIKLNSMDSLSHGERSILYIIPQLSAIKEHVVFQSPQLIFLNINNTYDLNLREIKARVLKDDLSSFRCYGLSEIVMIIKEKDEI
jgi:hypothetical protein